MRLDIIGEIKVLRKSDQTAARFFLYLTCLNIRLKYFALVIIGFLFAQYSSTGLSQTLSVRPDCAIDSKNHLAKNNFCSISDALKYFKEGDRLIIHPGLYRESISLLKKDWAGDQSTIIEGVDSDLVQIVGSVVVTNWQALGDNTYVKHNWEINSQQVFVDGQQMQQINGSVFSGFPESRNHWLYTKIKKDRNIWPGRTEGNVKTMPSKSFLYDSSKKALFLKLDGKSNIADKVVEVSVLPYLVSGDGVDGLVLRSIKFRHSNSSSVSRKAAVHLKGNNIEIDDIHIDNADSVGLRIVGNHNYIHDSSSNYSGQLGMSARGSYVKFYNNVTNFNNTRGFDKWWEAGGIKLIGNGGLKNSIIASHTAMYNNGDGVWFDNGNSGIVLEKCLLSYNKGHGLHYEASKQAKIKDNIITYNSQRGIYLRETTGIDISFNLIAENEMEGFAASNKGMKGDSLKFYSNLLFNNGRTKNHLAMILPDFYKNVISDFNLFVSSKNTASEFIIGWPNRLKNKSMSFASWKKKTKYDQNSDYLYIEDTPYSDTAIRARKYEDGYLVSKMKAISRGYPIRKDLASSDLGKEALKLHPGPWN